MTIRRNATRPRSLRWLGSVAFASLLLAASGAAAVDSDGDGIDDLADNCPQQANPGQQDSDGDGYGNVCDGDFNNDGAVNFADLAAMRLAFFTTDPAKDLNGDGIVNFADLAVLRKVFLQPPAGPPQLNLTSPAYGAYFPPGGGSCNVNYAGNVPNVPDVDLRVQLNGATIGTAGSAFSTNRTITGPLQQTLVEARRNTTGKIDRIASVVSCADFIPRDSLAFSGLGLRINDRGLDKLEPVLATAINNEVGNLGSLVNGQVFNLNQCVLDASIGCAIEARSVRINSASAGAFGLGLDAITNAVAVSATANSLAANYSVDLSNSPDCSGTASASSVVVTGNFGFGPLASDRSKVDINLLTTPGVTLNNLNNNFTGGPCSFPILEGFINNSVVPQIRTTVISTVQNELKDPDGSGPADSPIADVAENAFAGFSLQGAIGAALGLNLSALFAAITEDNVGVTFNTDANITSPTTGAGSPNPPESLALTQSFPSFGANTPSGLAYGVALGISANTLNKLLRSETQKGSLKLDITSVNLDALLPGLGNQTLTTTILGAIFPPFAAVSPAENVVIRIRPTLAPAVVDVGNDANLTRVRVAGVQGDIVGLSTARLYARTAIQGELLVNIAIAGNQIDATLQQVQGLEVTLVDDNLGGLNQTQLSTLMGLVAPLGNLSLVQSLESIPLPSILGLNLVPRQVFRDQGGRFITLFADFQ